MDLIDWLKSELAARGMSQVEIGRRVGLSELMVSRIVNRNRGIEAAELVAILNEFGWPTPVHDTPLAELVRLAQGLDDEDVAHLTHLARRLGRESRSGS